MVTCGKVGSIVVAGDVTIDWLEWSTRSEEGLGDINAPNWELYEGTRMRPEEGGALLLANMVRAATGSKVLTYRITGIDCIPPEKVIHSIAVLDAYSMNKGKEKTYRIKRYGGFAGPVKNSLKQLPVIDDDPDAGLVVLDDAGNGFRDDKSMWPRAILDDGKSPIVILKMSRPLTSGLLWEHLIKSHAEGLIVLIGANDLRDMGVNISRRLSWERTAEDLAWQMAYNPAVRALAACRHLVIRLGLDGAIHYSNDHGKVDTRLFYDPAFAEDGFKERHKGDMQGVTAAFAAAFAASIAVEGVAGIGRGICSGIRRSRQLFELGFGAVKNEPAYPISTVFSPEGAKDEAIASVPIPPVDDHSSGRERHWTILESLTRGRLEEIAYYAVIKKSEDSLKSVPVARFGELITLDRTEIESYRSIKNLMREYLDKADERKPLSIAVFGPPGSGKSFGVTQLAKSIDPDRIVKKEYNLAQFNSVDDLTGAFHNVRDIVLEGKVPLVFFDEFDASSPDGNELGWLKYFLAPMQDGVFKDGEAMHPIGRAIFVFAGGTAHTFQLFSRERPGEGLSQEKKDDIIKKFRQAKGTDFISRLRGYVNVLGPNRANDDDAFFIIRRAILLRNLLKRKAPQIFDDKDNARIDPGVLRAFIKVPVYKHGARSMEAVIDMSMLAGRSKYEQAALPPAEQLELHVDPAIFSKLVLRDVLFSDAMERLAQAIHEQYRIDQKNNKSPDDPVMQPWESLREDLKDSNRSQASQIPEKLHRVGMDFMPFVEKPKKLFTFTDEQLETLAEMEHERWVAERQDEGWTSGEVRDPVKKITPYLVPWAELSEEVKNWDRDPVRRIPVLLEIAGFEVYPLQ
jgi:hypothetical protein